MNSVSTSTATTASMLELKERFRPEIKPEVNRVRANPFYPGGLAPQLPDVPRSQETTETQTERFELNLPGQASAEDKKIGTILNTLA